MSTQKHTTVELGVLTVDRRIQCPLDWKWIKMKVQEFDPRALGTIEISKRPDGQMVILDGQHRYNLAQLAGYKGRIPAIIHEGLTLAEEAALFRKANARRAKRAADKFRPAVIEGKQSAVDISKVLERYGWSIEPDDGLRLLKAIASLEKVYKLANGDGATVVDDVIRTVHSAWPDDDRGAHGVLLLSLGKLFTAYHERIDISRLIRELARVNPMRLVGDIKDAKETLHSKTLADAGAHVITNLYNRGLRSRRLPTWDDK